MSGHVYHPRQHSHPTKPPWAQQRLRASSSPCACAHCHGRRGRSDQNDGRRRVNRGCYTQGAALPYSGPSPLCALQRRGEPKCPRRDRQGTQGWGRAVSGVRTDVNVSARSQRLGLISLEYRGKVRPNMAGDSMGRASKIRDRPSSSSPTSRAWSLPQNEVS